MAGIITRTRQALKAFTRAFSGYDITGSSGKWPTSYMLNAPISQALAAGRLASRKIAHQAENNALIASIIQHSVTAIIGDGPTCKPMHPDPAINAQLAAAWNAF